MIDILKYPTLHDLRAAYISGEITPTDVTEAYLAEIESKDGEIHAYLEVYAETARAHAKVATKRMQTEGDKAPFMCGMPIAVKNNILIEGHKTTAASKILENYEASYDATIIARLREAGAVFLGGTNMDEFAMGSSTENSAFGVTKNPIDTSRVPGGSSGGSAAAVAGRLAPAALGTDTGGSIRQPASYCGLVGFKPTYGAVSRSGLIAMGSSLDQAGPLTHSVADAEAVHDAISGLDPLDSTTIAPDTYEKLETKESYTFGIPRAFLKEGIDAGVLEVFEKHITDLEAAGHKIVDIEVPLMEKGLAAYYIVMPAEVSSNLARLDGMRYGKKAEGTDLLDEYLTTRAEGFGAEVKRRILLGTYVLSSGYFDAYYGKAEAVRRMMRAELQTAFQSVDAIILPTTPTPAFTIGQHEDPLSVYAQDIFTVPVNLTGVPALSIPAGTTNEDGVDLPVGVQYIGAHGADSLLFDIGKKVYDQKQ